MIMEEQPIRLERHLDNLYHRVTKVMLRAKQLIEWDLQMKRHITWRVMTLLLVLVAGAPAAFADGAIVSLMSDEDRAVLAEFDQRRMAAITAATTDPEAVAGTTLANVLAGQPLSFDDGYDPIGDWRCRYLKLGGHLAIEVYNWFSCRIFDDGAGWVIQKLGGTERTMGRLYRLSADHLLYLGALHDPNEAPIWFGEDPSRNQMAVLSRLDDGRLRLEFPVPLAGSEFDILEFTR